MRVAIPAVVMVSLFAVACGGSTPKPPPLVEVPPALSPDAPAASIVAATPAAPAEPNVYKSDLEAWCNASSRAPGAAKASKEDRPRIVAEWIAAQLKSDRANELAKRMGTLDPGARKDVLRKQTEGQGIKACPFLDELL